MEHRTLKMFKLLELPTIISNICRNTNIPSYLETSGDQKYNLYLNVVHVLNSRVN
jgi:hypothetical protein